MPDMNQESDSEQSVKCPSCGAELVLESKNEDQSEDMDMKDAQTMPLDKLKEKINKKAGY